MGPGALALGLTLAVLRVAASTDARSAVPKDACVLLKLAEVQSVTPATPVGNAVNTTENGAGVGAVSCRWQWGTGGNAVAGHYYLDVSVADGSRLWPGTSPEDIKTGLLALAQPAGANQGVIPGVGDAAIFTSNAEIRTETRAYVKGMLLSVTLEGPDARAKKNQAIALLKAAASRL